MESIDENIELTDVKVETIESQMKEEVKCGTNESTIDESIDERSDVFSYTKRGEFTSETYKIEIRNLPKHIGYDTFKKLFKRLELKPLKTKLIGKPGAPTHSFVTFRCNEDRDLAINKLNNFLWKSKELIVRKANPIPDPLVEKRNEWKSDEKNDSKRIKLELNDLSEEELATALNDRVASLWRMPYTQQMTEKFNSIKCFLLLLHKEFVKIERTIGEDCPEFKQWFQTVVQKYDNKCCELKDIRVSTIVDGYRNKCEFTVGIDKTVGFRLGLYREGTLKVITPALNCPIIGDQMRKALNGFQKYINESELNGFDPETHSGHWRQVTVRTTSKESMIIMALHPQSLSEEEINEEKKKICDFYEKNSEFCINSVYIHISSKRHEISAQYLEHLFGEPTISETIHLDRSLHFRISPLAFFQINTIGAQILFDSIINLIKPNPEMTVLDICCGTGTIGLCLASKVKKVIGIELSAEAISDAKFNAQFNHISNVEYIEGKAENVISSALDSCGFEANIVAVIDPPRPGLNNSIIRALRSNSLLNRLVYVSCDPNKAIKNFIDLCRPPSKTYRGQPFVPIEAIPVDLFPHTNRCELVVLFERLTPIVE